MNFIYHEIIKVHTEDDFFFKIKQINHQFTKVLFPLKCKISKRGY